MLIYQPAFDAYHCAFRMLAILEETNALEVDRACILDFYLAFPSALASIRWPRTEKDARKISESLKNPYRDPINPAATFKRMRHLQGAAIRCLAASKYIQLSDLELGLAHRTQREVAAPLLKSIDKFRLDCNQVITDIFPILLSMPLLGKDGLKDRTKLMDFRYDAY